MNTMDKALGKVILVFTYGSGAAASMYQLRVDEVPFFDPLELWKLKFYRNAIKLKPEETIIHAFYVETWMKFDYRPKGRKAFNISPWKYEEDTYYLMEIDKFGRRFYHRGGLRAPPLDDSLEVPADRAEDRRSRRDWDPVPEREDAQFPALADKAGRQEQKWGQIEYDMSFDKQREDTDYEEVGEFQDRYNPNQKVTLRKPLADKKRSEDTIEPDGLFHSYQIVGTWNKRKPQEMRKAGDGSWTFEVVLGENRWEVFHLIQDNDAKRGIYPATAKSFKDQPSVGPGQNEKNHYWFLDCRDRVTVPQDQVGKPGDKYLVTFRWEKLKELTWEKLAGQRGEFEPSHYYLTCGWLDWGLLELKPDAAKRPGWFSAEVQMVSQGLEFRVVRNEDLTQVIFPIVTGKAEGPVKPFTPIGGPDDKPSGSWKIEDEPGVTYKISFFRDPDDCEPTSMRIAWRKTAS